MHKVPPIQTLAEELTLWTLNHPAKFPRCLLFTFGQGLDNETLNVVELIAEARLRSATLLNVKHHNGSTEDVAITFLQEFVANC